MNKRQAKILMLRRTAEYLMNTDTTGLDDRELASMSPADATRCQNAVAEIAEEMIERADRLERG